MDDDTSTQGENDGHQESYEGQAGLDRYPDRLTEEGRERGLSKADRQYLASGGETITADSKNAHVNVRHRIRSRVRESIVDFWLVTEFLSDHDRDLLFSPDNDEWDKWELEIGMKSAIEFFYEGLRDSELSDFETILTSAIHDAEQKRRSVPVDVDVDFEISVQEQPDIEKVYEKFRRGAPLTSEEVGRLLTNGYVRDEDMVSKLAEHARSNGLVENPIPPLLGRQLSEILGDDQPVTKRYRTFAHLPDESRDGAESFVTHSDYFHLEDRYELMEGGHEPVTEEDLLDEDLAAELNEATADDGTSDDTSDSNDNGAAHSDDPDASG